MSEISRIAVVGYGLVGKQHTRAIANSASAQLAAIVEPDDGARSNAVALNVPAYRSIVELLNEKRPDGVILATPTPSHLDLGLSLIRAGIPVLIEKPIALNVNEARKLTDAASSHGTPVLVGHHRRHSPVAQVAKQAIDNDEIGSIRSIQATCWLYKPDGYFAQAPWRTRKGAGPISVNLIHDVDLLRFFCGEVAKVFAVASKSRRGHENEDLAAAVLTFEDGAVATISVSDSIAAPWSWEMTSGENSAYPRTDQSCYLIGGSKGALSLPDLKLWRHKGAPDWWASINATLLEATQSDPLVAQVEHFSRVIQGHETPLVSATEGLRSLAVVEAVERSAKTGTSLTFGDVILDPPTPHATP